MRFSTRSRYAIRAMIDLATHETGSAVPRADIAWRQSISADYLAQLFRDLHAAGVVEGIKGPGGGYRLSRTISQISAADIVQAVEGPITVVNCQAIHAGMPESRLDKCPAHWLWSQVTEAIIEVLRGITLEDLVARTADCPDWFAQACAAVSVIDAESEIGHPML